jgi:RNA polymerase sigma-70 factor (ECF subfamily)
MPTAAVVPLVSIAPPLVAAAAGRDRAALAALARAVDPVLRSHARRALAQAGRGADADDAEELTAEVQAFLAGGDGGRPGWARYDAARAPGGVEGWLYGIVRNKVRRRVRDASRRERFDRAAAAAPAEVVPEPGRALDGARALSLVASLPRRERAALRLWLEDAPAREIAARLRFASPHAVDCCLSRGRARLRRLLEGEAPRAA